LLGLPFIEHRIFDIIQIIKKSIENK